VVWVEVQISELISAAKVCQFSWALRLSVQVITSVFVGLIMSFDLFEDIVDNTGKLFSL